MKQLNISISLRAFHALVMVAVLMFVASTAKATTISFENITNNTTDDLSGQLAVESTSVADGVEFKVTNSVGTASSITDIYFDLGTNTGLFTDISIFESSAGVSFDLAPHPSNLPGGTDIGFTSDLGGDSTAPATSANGVNASGEYITFMLTFGTGFNYDDYLADLMDGTFRVGMHIQAIGTSGDSDSYASVSTVPVPAAAWLFGTALFGFFATTRRKNNS